MLTAAATVLYAAVAIMCLLAARDTGRFPRTRAVWIAIALLFVFLATSRAMALEDSLRHAMRLWLQGAGEYGDRRSLQAPIAAALIGLGGLAMLAVLIRRPPAQPDAVGRRTRWASYAAAAMIGLVGLRLISLHAVDALLYGPLRLNWLIDIGASLLVATCAWTSLNDARSTRQRSMRRQRNKSAADRR